MPALKAKATKALKIRMLSPCRPEDIAALETHPWAHSSPASLQQGWLRAALWGCRGHPGRTGSHLGSLAQNADTPTKCPMGSVWSLHSLALAVGEKLDYLDSPHGPLVQRMGSGVQPLGMEMRNPKGRGRREGKSRGA